MISGFVVPFSFGRQRPLRNFVISRLFRLYPAYWVSLPLLTLVAIHIGLPHDPLTVIANVTMLQWFAGIANIGPGYWTLACELMFYAMCAGLFALRLLSCPALIGSAVVCALAGAMVPMITDGDDPRVPLDLSFYFAMFFMGLLLRLAFVDRSRAAMWWSTAMVPLIMATGVVVGGTIVPVASNEGAYFSPLALSVSMALPVLVFVLLLWRKPAPGPIAMVLGTISYSVYLFQDVALRFLPDVIAPGRHPLIYVPAVIAMTVAIAAAVYRWVERPTIALGRRLTHAPAATAITEPG
jgi:peptidoglycan/LPS O-acetylase OafA/YrhL